MSLYEEMFGLVRQLGPQLRDGHAAGAAALGGARPAAPASVTICALGGSAIGGSLAEALWRDSLRAPTAVNRAAALPGWVGPGHLVVAVSYSGATAETLAAARTAIARGADVIAVTAGNPLGDVVTAAGGAVVRVAGGLPPRAALGSLFGALAAASSTPARHRRRPARSGPPPTPATPSRAIAAEPRERARRGRREHHDLGLRARPAGGSRTALQEPAQREREVDRGLRRAARGRSQRDRRLGGHRPHRRSPRRDPSRRPRRSGHDPGQHRHDAAPDPRRRDAASRAHRARPDEDRARLLAALAARSRLGLHGAGGRGRPVRDRPHRRAQAGPRRGEIAVLAPADVIRLESDAVVLLDQTRLPGERVDRHCTTVAELCAAIRELAIRGAPAIGIAAAMGMAQAARCSTAADTPALRAELARASSQLAASRPTAVNLAWALARCRAVIDGAAGPPDDLRTALAALARRIHDDEVARCVEMGRHGAGLLPAGARVLTHCNAGALATGGYGSALGSCGQRTRATPTCTSGSTRRVRCCRARG